MLITLSCLLLCILLLSVFKPNLNAGVPALVLSLFVAPLITTPQVGSVASLFPSSLFLTLLGVTLFFSTLNANGLIDALLQRILKYIHPFPRLVPAALFFLVATLTSIGLGNIAAIALIAPLAIPLAGALKLSPFLMTLLLVGGANAASFSPLTLPGIFTNDFIQKSGALSAKMNSHTMRWWIFWLVFITISASTAISFFILGGRSWLKQSKSINTNTQQSDNAPDSKHTIPLQELTRPQKTTAFMTAALALLFVTGCIAGLEIWNEIVPQSALSILRRAGDVSFIGWLGSAVMLISGQASADRSLRAVPWSTILLVCGMSTYIELLSRLGLPDVISSLVERNIRDLFMPSAFAASSALLSAFSSSVGVALPVFMPIVDAVSKTIESGVSQALVIAVAAGSHLVDASPLSTLGALCLAQIKDTSEQQRSYRQLLIYSFCMIPVAALWAFVFKLFFTASF